MTLHRILALLAFFVATGALAACRSNEKSSGGARKGSVTVTATTTHVADLVRNVGGDRVDVRRILEPNADPHDYEPRPSDAKGVAMSKVVFQSGGDLDEWLSGVVKSAGGERPVVKLIDSTQTIQGEGEEPGAVETDPHWWQDPRNAERAVSRIRDELAKADPEGRDTYRQNAETYLRKVRALDKGIERCIASVPRDKRKLVTSHDAFGYYADRYGIEVVGAVIPALTTQGQPSAGETAELAWTIRRGGVKTIFAESAVNPKVEKAIARESGAKVGRPLWADALGPQSSDGATYLASLATNTRALVEGFGGQASSCELQS